MLRKAGYKVGVVALDAPLSPLRWDMRLKISVEDGITVIRSKLPQVMWRGLPGDATVSRIISQRALRKYEQINGKPDIIHAHSVFPGIYTASTASEMWDVPYVLTEHRTSSLTRPKNAPRTKSLTKYVQRANGRSAVSRLFAQELTKFYGTDPWKILTLPVLDRDAGTPLPELNEDCPFVFSHISYFDARKREKMTLRAFARAIEVEPNIKMVMAGGKGKELQEVTNYRDELDLKDSVDVYGRLPREQIAGLLSEAHCFVLASNEEAAGIVFAEAQMAGLPCIGTLTYGGDYMIEPETGIQVPIDDENALTQAMINMARDRHNRFQPDAIRERAKERFSEKTFVDASTDFYNSALRDYTAKK